MSGHERTGRPVPLPPEVAALHAAYGEAIDAADLDALGALFAHGELADGDGTVIATGADGVESFYRSIVQLHDDGTPRTTHLLLQPVARSVPGDDGALEVLSRYLVLQQVEDRPLVPMVTGRYRDLFHLRVDGDGVRAWVWTRREFTMDLHGDISAHLRLPL